MSHPPNPHQVADREVREFECLPFGDRTLSGNLSFGRYSGRSCSQMLPKSRLLLCDLGAVGSPLWVCSTIHLYDERVGL